MRPWVGALALVVALGGCVAPPEPVSVELVNETGFNVVPNLFASGGAEDPESLFGDGANLRTDFVDRPIKELLPRESASLQFDCESLSSLGSRGAKSFDPVTFAVREAVDQPFLLNGVDFACGKIVRLVYSLDEAGFRVRVDVTE